MIERDETMTLPGVVPVQLPAPAPGSDRAPSLAFRALVSVSLLVGLFVLAFAIVLALIGLNVLVAQTGRVVVPLVVVTLAVVLSIGRGLFAMIRKPPEPDGEIEGACRRGAGAARAAATAGRGRRHPAARLCRGDP